MNRKRLTKVLIYPLEAKCFSFLLFFAILSSPYLLENVFYPVAYGQELDNQCPPGQGIEPDSGQCVELPGAAPSQAIQCPPGQGIEPDSGQCVELPGNPTANPTGTPEGPVQTGSGEPSGEEGPNIGDNNLLPFNLPPVTSPEPIADMLPLIIVVSIVVIGGIALGKYSKNRNRGRRIKIPPSAVVNIYTKGGTRE